MDADYVSLFFELSCNQHSSARDRNSRSVSVSNDPAVSTLHCLERVRPPWVASQISIAEKQRAGRWSIIISIFPPGTGHCGSPMSWNLRTTQRSLARSSRRSKQQARRSPTFFDTGARQHDDALDAVRFQLLDHGHRVGAQYIASFSATCRTPSSEITRGSKSIITSWLEVSISVRRTPGSSRSGTGKRLSSDLLWSFVAAELSFRIRYKIRGISLIAPQGLASSNLFLRSLLKDMALMPVCRCGSQFSGHSED